MISILVNAVTCSVGGGLQVTQSCLENWSKIDSKEIKILFLVNEKLRPHLTSELNQKSNIIFFKYKQTHLLFGFLIKRRIKAICNSFSPDMVYSIGFPSFIKFNCTELGRYTNPLEIMNVEYMEDLKSLRQN